MKYKSLIWKESYMKNKLTGWIASVNITYCKLLIMSISIPALDYDGEYNFGYYIDNQLIEPFELMTMEEAKERANETYICFMNTIYDDFDLYVNR